MKVETSISRALNLEEPQTDMEKAMSDATNYRFATDDMDDLIIHGSYLKEEFNREAPNTSQNLIHCRYSNNISSNAISIRITHSKNYRRVRRNSFDILNKRIENSRPASNSHQRR